jgi:hypothetical protein
MAFPSDAPMVDERKNPPPQLLSSSAAKIPAATLPHTHKPLHVGCLDRPESQNHPQSVNPFGLLLSRDWGSSHRSRSILRFTVSNG